MLEVHRIRVYEKCELCGEVEILLSRIETDCEVFEICEDCRKQLLYKLVRV